MISGGSPAVRTRCNDPLQKARRATDRAGGAVDRVLDSSSGGGERGCYKTGVGGGRLYQRGLTQKQIKDDVARIENSRLSMEVYILGWLRKF